MNLTRKEFLKKSGNSLLLLTAASLFGSCSNNRGNAGKQKTGGTMVHYKIKKLNLKHTWTIARNSADYKNNVFVRIEKDGVFGIGEAAPNIRYNETPESTVDTIEKAKPLFQTYPLWHFVELGDAIRNVGEEQTAAKAALDIAIMDWVSKKMGVPLFQYLGLDKSKVPVTSFSIGIDTPEVVRQKIIEAEPYPILKIKVGKDNDEEMLDTVRSVTDKPLRVDANEGWTRKEEALEKIKWLATQGVEFIEQPMPASMFEDIKWLRERVEMPIIADEAVKRAADIPKLAEAYDGINIKLMKSAGIQEALRMIYMARALGMKIMLGCMIESSVAIAAAAHISPLVDWVDLDGNLLISNDPFHGLSLKNGKIGLNDQPGLGLEGEF
ncbi:dipeptide epimerase [candidate division KSB1 bacterium]|nr:dipeptide epimerase [candidate division KSB1 bacterium]